MSLLFTVRWDGTVAKLYDKMATNFMRFHQVCRHFRQVCFNHKVLIQNNRTSTAPKAVSRELFQLSIHHVEGRSKRQTSRNKYYRIQLNETHT